MSKYLYLFSIARQGHHAVLEWLCKQAKTATYFNNCLIKDHKIILQNWRYDYKDGIEVRAIRIKKIEATKIDTKESDLVIFNFINEGIIENLKIHTWIDKTQPNYCVVVRDIYNCWASMLRRNLRRRDLRKEDWIELVKTAMGDYSIPEEINFTDISFNRWFADSSYRENLTQRLGLELRDNRIGDESEIGRSSFALKEIDKHKIDVLSRWQFYKNDPKLWDDINYEVEDLCKRYFKFFINQQTKEVVPCNKNRKKD